MRRILQRRARRAGGEAPSPRQAVRVEEDLCDSVWTHIAIHMDKERLVLRVCALSFGQLFCHLAFSG